MRDAINTLLNGEDLTPEQSINAMKQLMEGEVDEVTTATFLTALRMKGETVDEITAFTKVLREKALKITPKVDVIDIVGTGGDGANTFNISTTTSFVVAAFGMGVAKHGNRSVSSKSGSADVLEELGVQINLTPPQAQELLDRTNMTFMFAPAYHSSMKHVASTRAKMKIRTVFNTLGPLLNPALANYQLMGVYQKGLLEPMAEVLSNLGLVRALVVHGSDGLDEATLTGVTYVCEVSDGAVLSYHIDPQELGFKLCTASELVGGDARDNAAITRAILNGRLQGPKRDIVVLNSALALYVAQQNVPLSQCVQQAKDIIDSGKAYKKLNELIKVSNLV